MTHKDLKNKYYLDWIQFLRESENWSAEQIGEYQLNQLKKNVIYAQKNTKGYRKNFEKAGVSPKEIKSIKDFQKVPFIDKETIRDNLDDFTTKIRIREYITTGGSTGIPFGFYRTPLAFARELASKAYQYYRIGWKEGSKQMVFRGLQINTPDRIEYFPEFNELRCSSLYLTPEQMETYRIKAWDYKPEFIKCYPSSGYLFAKYLRDSGKKFPPVKAVLCASENLYDFQKKLLAETFNCRIFSHYGHYELAVLAGFCEKEDTYHVLPQYGFAELVDSNGKVITTPGQSGEVVSTSFIMHATMFVRYKTGDRAVFKSFGCPSCHRPYQIWEGIDGRLQEFILSKNGRLISLTTMNMHDSIFDDLKQFQYLQKTKGNLEFQFMPKKKLSSLAINKIKIRLSEKLGRDVNLHMQEVSKIPLTPRGKHRFLIQKLNIMHGDK